MELQDAPADNPLPKPILTEQELSALADTKSADPSTSAGERRGKVTPYDFRCPDRASKEQVRSLYLIHDSLARSLSSRLPNFLRAICEVSLISLDQRSYVDYISGLPDPAAMFKLSMAPLNGMAVLELAPSLACSIIECQLGGGGLPAGEARTLTDIDQQVMSGALDLITDGLRSAWAPIANITFRNVGCETFPKMLQIVAPNEIIISIGFHMQVGEARGGMSLCIPAVNLEPIFEKLSESSYSHMHPDVPAEQTKVILDKLSSVSFPLAAEIQTKALINDLVRLQPGDLMRLDHPVEEPVDITVGGIVKFQGELALQDKRTAVCIRPIKRQEN